VLYHFDTNGKLTTVDLGGRFIKNIAVTQTGDTLYFEDYAQGSYNVGKLSSNGQLQILHRNCALVGVVGNTLYFGSIDSSGLVTRVYKNERGGPVLVKTFQTPVRSEDIMISQNGQVSTSTQT
jgi:sugar lactone lactonase YvrE